MGRARKPERNQAQELWDESQGTLSLGEIAKQLGTKIEQIRKWKSLDKWTDYDDTSPTRKKNKGGQIGNTNAKDHGAPKGNTNAKDHGAPKGNTNAETHGAYSTVRLSNLPKSEIERILSLGLDVEKNLLEELRILQAKESDLERRIKDLQSNKKKSLHTERVVTVEGEENGVTTTTEASTFEQVQKLEAAQGRVHSRIIKILDSIKSHKAEKRRGDLEQRRHILAVRKLSGVFDLDPVTGLIDDNSINGIEDYMEIYDEEKVD